jgi:hypothetical protein
MDPNPASKFGSLLRGCISDEYLRPEKRVLAEGAAFLLLGVCCSVATTYLLSVAGVLV